MYKGKPCKGLAFYNLLFESNEFISELGKVTMASGRLEAELVIFLKKNEIKGNYHKATLGTLISKIKVNSLLDKNIIHALEQISIQRNYLIHNIYALFSDQLDETIIEKHNLLDTDVITYLDRAWQLKENLIGLSDIIAKENNK
jgi:hypothetical protein